MESVEPASATDARNYAAKQQEASNAPRENRMRAASTSEYRTSIDSGGRHSLDEKEDDSTGLRQRLKAAIRKSTTIS